MMDFTKSNQNLIISPSAKYNVMIILNQPTNSEVIISIVSKRQEPVRYSRTSQNPKLFEEKEKEAEAGDNP